MFPNQYPGPMFNPGFTQNNNIQYVNGKASAEAYNTQPNQSVLLMDSNEDRFYIVRSDASNFKTIEEYEFHKVEEKKTSYVTQDDFNELKALVESYKPLLDTLKE